MGLLSLKLSEYAKMMQMLGANSVSLQIKYLRILK